MGSEDLDPRLYVSVSFSGIGGADILRVSSVWTSAFSSVGILEGDQIELRLTVCARVE